MSFDGVSHLAVVMAAVASFLFGGIWYGALSGPWLAAANVKLEDIKVSKGGAAIQPYVVAFIGLLVMAYFLAGLLSHFGSEHFTIKGGLLTSVSVWLGFVMAPMAVNHAFQGAKVQLTLIDGGHWLGVLLIQGAILGYMGAGG